jgi:hypothetical protein
MILKENRNHIPKHKECCEKEKDTYVNYFTFFDSLESQRSDETGVTIGKIMKDM